MLYLYLVIYIQTVFESLPVSSSGHIALLDLMCQKYMETFQCHVIPIHIFEPWFHSLHAITAFVLALFFFQNWFFLLAHLARTWRIVLKLIAFVGIADLITCIFYVMFHIYPVDLPLWVGFCATGLLLISLRFVRRSDMRRSWSIRDAILLGIVQGVALLPGISRLAATFVASRWLGYSNERAFQLTWMIQWPLIAAASLVGFYQLHQYQVLGEFYSGGMLMAYFIAGVGAYSALYVLQWCVERDRVWWFAYYMAIPIGLALFL